MDVKQAATAAKTYVADLLRDENPTNLGLEEVEFDRSTGTWNITVGFSRPWNSTRGPLTTLAGEPIPKRAYRVVSIRDVDGEVLSMKRRELSLQNASDFD
ncbi:MAG: hypothetical protein HY834_17895 [Devosia nanyangense]|uniref:Uncharacterized protein n=1 Tax=Devosia nanyangense TaxID=1228055 RepID=A0A933P0H0_9HYPH|nr:hypothetical protein [Devosia nanyangense]